MHLLGAVPGWAVMAVFTGLIGAALLKPSELDKKGDDRG